ncbi:MAG: Holliday junction resolvase RuvX [Miltoncostaeaceae bacterium]
MDARVVLVDERMSTAEAERRARETGSASDIDSLAACVILESWLAAQQEAA